MEEKIKIFIFPILCLAAMGLFGYLLYEPTVSLVENINSHPQLKEKISDLEQKKATLQKDKEAKKNIELEGSKSIYENVEFNFSPEASFAPLIEKFIDISKLSGVRIHSIDYNYAPIDDPVFVAQYAGYNTCELSVAAVGHYNNLRKLFETLVADVNVMNLAEIDITPWEADHSILIGRFKLRLYTKTM